MKTAFELSRFFGTANEFDKTAVLLHICEHDTSVLLRAVEAVASTPSWKKEIEALLHGSKKINAIKLWREKTGASLKEAKDAVEAIQKVMGL